MFDKKIFLFIILIIFLLGISAVNAQSSLESDKAFNKKDIAVSNPDNKSETNHSLSLIPSKLSTTYASGKYFKVKVIDSKSKKAVPNVDLILKVFTGKKYKKVAVKGDSKGIAKYSVSSLSPGKHKIIVNVKNTEIFTSKSKSSSVKISRADLTISAPKITTYFNKNNKFKISIKNKGSKKPMKNIKLSVKVYTGSKYINYNLKTGKTGVVNINTKYLSKGVHKVIINVKSNSMIKSVSAKSSIKTVESFKYIKLKVNGHIFNVKLNDNRASKELLNKLKQGNIKIHAEDYGNFEKVGDLGFSLPANDKYVKTSPGDIVLYNGNEISLFYESNSWSYTKLGKIQNTDNLKKILGNGDVVLILSLK